jgi:hypothetical protein
MIEADRSPGSFAPISQRSGFWIASIFGAERLGIAISLQPVKKAPQNPPPFKTAFTDSLERDALSSISLYPPRHDQY